MYIFHRSTEFAVANHEKVWLLCAMLFLEELECAQYVPGAFLGDELSRENEAEGVLGDAPFLSQLPALWASRFAIL